MKMENFAVADVTDHGRVDHPNQHYHPAKGPNSVESEPHPLPSINLVIL